MGQHLHALLSLWSTPVWATNQSKYLFSVFLEYILWAKIQCWWKHERERASILLSPYSPHIYACFWFYEMVANNLRNTCLVQMRPVWYFISHSIRMLSDVLLHRYFLPKVDRVVRFLWPSLYSSTPISLQHSTQVSHAWDQGINMAMQIRESCALFLLHYTISCI